MVNVIFCIRGKLACAMLESVQVVYSDVNVEAVVPVSGENASDIVEKLKKLVNVHTDDEWLITVDLQRDSPWNAAATLATYNPAIRVISGLSLPLALELVDNQSNINADELYEYLATIVQQTCVVWKHLGTTEEDS